MYFQNIPMVTIATTELIPYKFQNPYLLCFQKNILYILKTFKKLTRRERESIFPVHKPLSNPSKF